MQGIGRKQGRRAGYWFLCAGPLLLGTCCWLLRCRVQRTLIFAGKVNQNGMRGAAHRNMRYQVERYCCKGIVEITDDGLQ